MWEKEKVNSSEPLLYCTALDRQWCLMALFHCMVRHGTVRYGSLLGGFPLGTVPGTWYFFSTTSVEVPSSRTVTKTWRVNSADHWMAGEYRHYCVTELATRDPPLPPYPLDLNQHSQRRIGRNFCLNKRTFLHQPQNSSVVVCWGSTDVQSDTSSDNSFICHNVFCLKGNYVHT